VVRRLAAESGDDPTGWFERLYAAAERGEAVVPWDRGAPHRLLVRWAEQRDLDGAGRAALVVGSGPGEDAEFFARLGFATTAFDVSETAVRAARQRFPGSPVRYLTADLLEPPPEWAGAFDLVVESMTVQSMPERHRRAAIANVARFVGPGGTLVVVAFARDDGPAPDEGPPWPLSRADIDAFALADMRPVQVEDVPDAAEPDVHRWLAEFTRPA
jgi:SAM-dependent methyltransferase